MLKDEKHLIRGKWLTFYSFTGSVYVNKKGKKEQSKKKKKQGKRKRDGNEGCSSGHRSKSRIKNESRKSNKGKEEQDNVSKEDGDEGKEEATKGKGGKGDGWRCNMCPIEWTGDSVWYCCDQCVWWLCTECYDSGALSLHEKLWQKMHK